MQKQAEVKKMNATVKSTNVVSRATGLFFNMLEHDPDNLLKRSGNKFNPKQYQKYNDLLDAARDIANELKIKELLSKKVLPDLGAGDLGIGVSRNLTKMVPPPTPNPSPATLNAPPPYRKRKFQAAPQRWEGTNDDDIQFLGSSSMEPKNKCERRFPEVCENSYRPDYVSQSDNDIQVLWESTKNSRISYETHNASTVMRQMTGQQGAFVRGHYQEIGYESRCFETSSSFICTEPNGYSRYTETRTESSLQLNVRYFN